MPNLIKHILNTWPLHFAGHFSYALGLSGGVDSIVLLHALTQIKAIKPLDLSVIHINHGISPNANAWQDFCKQTCHELKVPLVVTNYLITKKGGESLENNARLARYRSFIKHKATVIILAHQQNDQIETTLSQIFRGSDLHNIGSMQKVSGKQGKIFWRPLLDLSRQEIENYAKAHNLSYISDESNLDSQYLRNFIRQDILPKLTSRDPYIGTKILHLNQQLQSTLTLIDQLAAIDLAKIAVSLFKQQDTLLVDQFSTLTYERQINLINYFIKQHHLPLPTQKQIKEFIHQALTSQWDKKPRLNLSLNYCLLKHKNHIYINNLSKL